MYRQIFQRIFPANRTAIIDRFGEITYAGLQELTASYIDQLEYAGCTRKRILLEGGNHRHLIALMLALAETGNELFVQEVKSTDAETGAVISDHRVNASIDADKARTALEQPGAPLPVKHYTDAGHSIAEGKWYYFSSGSTGKPKVFGFTSRRLADLLKAWYSSIGQAADEIVLCPPTATHFHGTMIAFSALLNGNTLIFCNTDHLNAADLEALLETHRPTLMSGTPYHYQKLLTHLAGRENEFNGLSDMRLAICGSAPLSKSLADRFHDRFGIYLHQGYGLSEIGVICIDIRPELGTGTVGPVIDDVEYRIISDSGETVPEEEAGELIVRAPFMATEYLGQEALTRQTFKDGWLHTGDIVREDGLGRITIVGRKSQFINIAGLKVYPAEIEKAIIAWDPSLSVAIREEEASGKPVIAAYLETPAAGKVIDLEGLREYLGSRLANYKQPGRYVIVDELPKNAVGKVRYNQIRKTSPTTHS